MKGFVEVTLMPTLKRKHRFRDDAEIFNHPNISVFTSALNERLMKFVLQSFMIDRSMTYTQLNKVAYFIAHKTERAIHCSHRCFTSHHIVELTDELMNMLSKTN